MVREVIYTVTTGRHKYLRMPVDILHVFANRGHGDTELIVRGQPYNSDIPEVWMNFRPEDFTEFPVELKAKLSMMRLKGELK